MSSRTPLDADRRAFVAGLGVAAAGAAFGSWTSASAALPGLTPQAAVVVARTPAIFWNLGYLDWTGAAEPAPRALRPMAAAERDDDPHAELLRS